MTAVLLILLDRFAAWLTGSEGWLPGLAGAGLLVFAAGHCDGMDGPVVRLARRARKDFPPDDVEAGREYVEAYVPYVHYVEKVWETASAPAHGHYAEPQAHAHSH